MAEENYQRHPSEKKRTIPLCIFFKDARLVFKMDDLGKEIAKIALPAAMALAADPLASLVDTAFIGQIGPVELAAVGVSIAVFNQVSRIAIFPLVSITTSFVAEEDTTAVLSTAGTQDIGNIDIGSAVNSGDKKEDTTATLSSVDTQDIENVDIGSTVNSEDKKEDTTATLSLADTQDIENIDIGSAINNEGKKEDTTAQSSSANTQVIENIDIGSVVNSEDKKSIAQTGPECSPSNSIGSIYKSEPVARSKDIVKSRHVKRKIPSASSALIIGSILGLIQAFFLIFAAKPILNIMGAKSDSPMLQPAHQYLTLRSLGAPAVLLSLAMQGVFRGFKDTKTPLYAIMAGDLTNIILDPIFIFYFRLGVRGAAIAHVISQYLISLILFWRLWLQVDLIPPSIKYLQLGRFLHNGFHLLMRVIAVTICVTLAASMAARLGSTSMAAFQVCLQLWLTTSLLADGLAVAGQAILASAFARKDYDHAIATVSRVLQLGLVLGFVLALVLGVGLQFGGRVFTKDVNVLHLISIGLPFVAATQPINALAFVFDGVNFGASDFAYSAYSMVVVSIASIVLLFTLSPTHGFIGIWVALTIYMTLRALVGFWRIGTGTGPWEFLRS